MIGWITNDPEVAAKLRAADLWEQDQRRRANRAAFEADKARRAASALLAKAKTDLAEDYARILADVQEGLL